jgi:hypothetical protein
MESDSRKQRVSSMVNDRVYNALWGFGAEDGAFACECGRSSCAEEIVMTPSAYVRLRDRGEIVTAHRPGDLVVEVDTVRGGNIGNQ